MFGRGLLELIMVGSVCLAGNNLKIDKSNGSHEHSAGRGLPFEGFVAGSKAWGFFSDMKRNSKLL